MKGMVNKVGTLFGQGKMFPPQVVKCAYDSEAVRVPQPYIEAENRHRRKRGR